MFYYFNITIQSHVQCTDDGQTSVVQCTDDYDVHCDVNNSQILLLL